MFDANMRYIEEGKKFFAEVYNSSKGTLLYNSGIRNGEVVYCTMSIGRTEETDNPTVTIHLVDRDVVITHEQDFEDTWLVYAGCVDKEGKLHDFIDKSVEKKAGKVLNKLKRRE